MPRRWVLIRDPDGTFPTQARLSTDPAVAAEQILAWFVPRWQRAGTFEETRRHRGVQTPRQWSDLAIGRTTPALLGLFSLVTRLAHPSMAAAGGVRQAAWYPKSLPTVADALAVVRRQLWQHTLACTSDHAADMQALPRSVIERLTAALCSAA